MANRKSHKEFEKEVADASSLPAQTERALAPESQEDKDMYKEEICKCGHSKYCHAAGIGGCFHAEGKPKSIIVNFDDVACECNKFDANCEGGENDK